MTIKLDYSDVHESLLLLDKSEPRDYSNLKKINLMIDATNKCQLGCTYCYFGEKGCLLMNNDKQFMAIKKFASAIGSNLETLNIHYMGGEPLIGWNKILDLNKKVKTFCQEKGLNFAWSLTSNLVSFNEEKRNHMISEGAGIHCSVDGPKFIQDINRPFRNGKSSFKAVDRNISLALEVSPNDTARVTITPASSHHVGEIVEYLFNKGFNKVGLFPALNLEWKDEDFEAWKIGIKNGYDLAFQHKKKITTIIRLKHHEKPEFEYCGGGKGLWALDVNGVLYNCHRLTNDSKFAVVDASVSSIEEIRDAIKNKTFAPHTIEAPDKCKKCTTFDFCSGGCWVDNIYANDNPYLPETLGCKFKQITKESILEYIETTPNQINKRNLSDVNMEICCILMDACIFHDGHDPCECQSCEWCDVGCNSCMWVCDPHD